MIPSHHAAIKRAIAFFQSDGEINWDDDMEKFTLSALRRALRTEEMDSGEAWQTVPAEPTPTMIAAGSEHCMRDDDEEPYRARGQAMACYLDMLAMAPKVTP